MRLRTTTLTLALVVGGCALINDRVQPAHGGSPAHLGWATIETDRARLDGDGDLYFRLLIGAHDGGVVIDRRLIPNTNLNLVDVWDCDGGVMPVPHIIADYFPDAPGRSDLLEIRAYDWFGTEEKFPLFLPSDDGGNVPSCVLANFTFSFVSAANPSISFSVMGSRLAPLETDAGQP